MKRFLVIAGLALAAGCDQTATSEPTASTHDSTTVEASPPSSFPLTPFSQRYLQQARRHCASALFEAQQLELAIHSLLAATTGDNLKSTQQQWEKAQARWLQCSLFSHSDGPLDTPEAGDPFAFATRIGNWPASAGYVDSTPEYPHSGLVNSPDVSLTRSSLLQQHLLTAPNETSVGLYALEVLLFGANASRTLEELTPQPVQPEQLDTPQRRRDYLALLGQLYASDLKTLVARWDPELASYPKQLAELSPPQQQRLLINGLRLRLLDIAEELNALEEEGEERSSHHEQRLSVPLQALLVLAENSDTSAALTQRVKALLEESASPAQSDKDTQPEAAPSTGSTLAEQIESLARELNELLGNPSNTVTASAQQLDGQQQ
ncbi:imelysin family protein [Aestuariirhabdus sp. LZHN29]|uniref:imelysin family protein n=1 Tax=Aestuariirhabdus sp. LZHN29 TaxID=3417462 RepID=UPI003CEE31BF